MVSKQPKPRNFGNLRSGKRIVISLQVFFSKCAVSMRCSDTGRFPETATQLRTPHLSLSIRFTAKTFMIFRWKLAKLKLVFYGLLNRWIMLKIKIAHNYIFAKVLATLYPNFIKKYWSRRELLKKQTCAWLYCHPVLSEILSNNPIGDEICRNICT